MFTSVDVVHNFLCKIFHFILVDSIEKISAAVQVGMIGSTSTSHHYGFSMTKLLREVIRAHLIGVGLVANRVVTGLVETNAKERRLF